MSIRLIFFLILFSLPQSGFAGPWLRDKGTSFTAVSMTGTYALETTNQTFIEYGLTEKTTLVGDVNLARFHYAPGTGHATVSIRRALSAKDATSKWAYELGIGAGWANTEARPLVRTALSWGRGTSWGEKSGWVTVEGAVFWGFSDAPHVTKIDTTIGLNFTDATKGMLQLYAAHTAGESTATFAPSLVFSPKISKFSIQIGAESPLGHRDNTALKIGLWRTF